MPTVTAAGGPALPNIQNTGAPGQSVRAADGDYKTPGAGRSSVKDADGDYKALSTAQSTASTRTQAGVLSQQLKG